MQAQSCPRLLEQTVESTWINLLCTGAFLRTELEGGKLHFCNTSLAFLGILGRFNNCKKFPVSKEVLVEDQYLREA